MNEIGQVGVVCDVSGGEVEGQKKRAARGGHSKKLTYQVELNLAHPKIKGAVSVWWLLMGKMLHRGEGAHFLRFTIKWTLIHFIANHRLGNEKGESRVVTDVRRGSGRR